MAPTTQHTLFTQAANAHLRNLHDVHARNLSSGADDEIRRTTRAARVIRRAVVVHAAICDITSLPASSRSDDLEAACLYLRGAAARMEAALRAPHVDQLDGLCAAAQAVLDGLADGHVFDDVEVEADVARDAVKRDFGPHDTDVDADGEPAQATPTDATRGSRKRAFFRRSSAAEADVAAGGAAPAHPSCCGLSCADLSRRDKLVLWLYLVMVLGAIVAVTAVTVDFVRQAVNPGSFIRSEVSDSLPAPVVTVCLSQTGVPFSRLQLFDFTDAEGNRLEGGKPNGTHEQTVTADFTAAVDRFWDNPDNEDCDAKVGDYYPFPLESLNRLIADQDTTRCRQCYRVGAKQLAIANDTNFQHSSQLSFYTDNYFLQCIKTVAGLSERSMAQLHTTLFDNRTETEVQATLSVLDGTSVADLQQADFNALTSRQLCNIFYFSLFPRILDRQPPTPPDVTYAYNGSHWLESGDGPYLLQKAETDFLPEESLQMFVGTNESTPRGELARDRDMILIGPNTQTYATFRPIIVYDEDRYDISSSTTNLREDDVIPLFGYWLVYRVFYNYNRFVTDEWYRESTYPASQWIVDLTGYATLFTGASLFSLLLLPLLRTMRRREKQRLLRKKPEVYLWAKHRRKVGDSQIAPEGHTSRGVPLDEDDLLKTNSVMLPGYNV